MSMDDNYKHKCKDNQRVRILFLINSLGGGGAERVLVNLVNRMNINKYDITVETMYDDGNYRDLLKQDIHYCCKHSPCFKGVSVIYRFIPSQILYRYFIGNQRFDLVIAYMQGAPVKVISGCSIGSTKRIAWIHNSNPANGMFFNYWLSRRLAFRAYASFDAIAGVSNTVVKQFESYTNIHNNLYTIYNTNDAEQIVKMAKEPIEIKKKDGLSICCAGRLVYQKGFDRLIRVAKRLHDDGYMFHISIMGTGPESYKNLLKKQISSADANDYIEMMGFQSNPFAIMANSDIYVLSSRHEGLATVLTEALFCSVPIVATDVSGTREVLGENNEYGLVVPNNETGLYEGIKKMIENESLRKMYQEKSKARVLDFVPEATVAQAEQLFDQVLSMVGDDKC